MGNRAYFFKCASNQELKRWVAPTRTPALALALALTVTLTLTPTLTRTRTLTRWIADLSWRVEEGERKIAAKFEPGVKGGTQPTGGLIDPSAAHQGTLTLFVVLALALTLTLP
jgi:hypothetical protein